MMNNNKFEYFLNAVHYCIWLNDMKFGDFMGRIVNTLFSPIPKYLFTKEYKKKYYERLSEEQKKIELEIPNLKDSDKQSIENKYANLISSVKEDKMGKEDVLKLKDAAENYVNNVKESRGEKK